MSEVKHTPGPWRYVSRNIDGVTHWASRIPFAIEWSPPNVMGVAPVADILANPFVEVCDQPQAEANARLIAAAPDMEDGYRRILESVGMRPGHVAYLSRADIEAIARAAIAKAEGKS